MDFRPVLNGGITIGICRRSTNLQKNYDQATRSFHTTWSEINVACKACHGPGSQHVAWAKDKNVGPTSVGLGGLKPALQDSETNGLAFLSGTAERKRPTCHRQGDGGCRTRTAPNPGIPAGPGRIIHRPHPRGAGRGRGGPETRTGCPLPSTYCGPYGRRRPGPDE